MTGRGPRLQIMGPLRVWRDGVELDDLGPRQQRCLLAVLLARAGHPVSMSDLMASIWGFDAPPSAVNVIHKYVGALRRLLEPELALRTPGSYLLRGTSGYRFAAGPETLDLAEFRDLVAAGRAATGTPEEALERYAAALRLGRGPAGETLADSVGAAAAFAAIDGEFVEAAVAAADIAIRLRRPETVLAPLRLAAAMGPLNELAHARLITTLAMAGHPAEALATYRAIRERLAEDLGIDPGPTLDDAHRQVLGRETTLPAVRPAQLPPDLPTFAGRGSELAALDALVGAMSRDGRTAPLIVALDGMGGVGKSALAVHAAHRHAARFDDGQLYLDLRGDQDDDVLAGDALAALLYALGMPPARMPGTFDARLGAYRSLTAGRRFLVLLDNVHDPAQVRPLLPNSAASLVLLTSRRPLLGLAAFDGADLLHVEVPDPASARELLRRRLPAGATGPAVDEIIELCGRLPLALAILAARLTARPALSLESVAADLRDSARRLAVFPAGTGTPDPRSAFAWSYRQLGPGAARLFRLLSVSLSAGITEAACISLSGGGPAPTRAELEELSGSALIDEHPDGRFTCHVLVRAYAEELLHTIDGPTERRAATTRLLQHYLRAGLAAQAALLTATPTPPAVAHAGNASPTTAPSDGLRSRPANGRPPAVAHPPIGTPITAPSDGSRSRPANGRPPAVAHPPFDPPITAPSDGSRAGAAWLAEHRLELVEAVRVAADLGDHDTARNLAGTLRHVDATDWAEAERYVRVAGQSRPSAAGTSSTAPSA
ncbi:BTAD domain-containing putative transcriptional regulator [Actinoplanes sp. NPDC026670]|uniref:BTAD domain-containing putative transcriptional regulator n=1 Tax=Actinoplanes sp. NPDC026670 TaxID=3154700 RepID=UPI0033CFB93E